MTSVPVPTDDAYSAFFSAYVCFRVVDDLLQVARITRIVQCG